MNNKYQESLNNVIEAYQELEIRVGNNPDKVKDFDDIETLQELVDKVEQLEIANKNNEGLVRENVDLINRNLKLQDELKRCQDTINKWMNDNKQLIIDNGKLKQAIKILKNKFEITIDKDKDNTYWLENEDYCKYITQEEYELLKEVFENE